MKHLRQKYAEWRKQLQTRFIEIVHKELMSTQRQTLPVETRMNFSLLLLVIIIIGAKLPGYLCGVGAAVVVIIMHHHHHQV